MSVETMSIVLHHSKSAGTAKLVLLGIANHEGDGGAWPAVATLARYANADARSVQRALVKLEALGELRRDVQAGGDERVPDHRRPNRYRVTLECPPNCDRTSMHRTRDHGLIELPSGRVTQMSPGGASVTGRVTPVSPKPLRELSKTEREPYVGDRERARGDLGACGHKLIDGTRYCVYGCPSSAVMG